MNSLDVLGSLVDPSQYRAPINLEDFAEETLKSFLKSLILIRKTEQQLAVCRRDLFIGGPVHLGAGQEAVAVGVSYSLRKTDRVFGAHRSHSHLLALNPDFYRLFAETLGKDTGFSRGMGGSMHLWDQPNGFYGSVPIVAGTVSLAVGAGLAAKLQRKEGSDTDIGVAYLGDGAIEEGVVHESLNLASIQDIPVLFVVENNLFASHMHVSQRQPSNIMARFAYANNMESEVVDGNDVVSVAKTAKRLIDNARAGKGPGFLEAVTYRWYGHVDWRDDIDVGIERSVEDINNWKARDPVARLSQAMQLAGVWSEKDELKLNANLDNEIENAWNKAMDDPYPHGDSTLDYVYK